MLWQASGSFLPFRLYKLVSKALNFSSVLLFYPMHYPWSVINADEYPQHLVIQQTVIRRLQTNKSPTVDWAEFGVWSAVRWILHSSSNTRTSISLTLRKGGQKERETQTVSIVQW